jgi:hypothetical protein
MSVTNPSLFFCKALYLKLLRFISVFVDHVALYGHVPQIIEYRESLKTLFCNVV